MVAQATLRIDANTVATYDQFSLAAGADKVVAVATADDATSYIASTAANVKQSYDIDTTFPETMAHIISLAVKARLRSNSGSAISNQSVLFLNATEQVSGTAWTATTTWADFDSGALARPGGGDWTEDDLRLTGANKFEFGIFHPSQTPLTWCTELYVLVTYIPLERTIDLEREVASRRLRLNREPEQTVSIINGWEALEAELMDPVGYSNAQGPTHDAKGWGVEDWKRGFGRLKSQTISLSMPRVKSTIGDRRRFQTTLWDVMKLTVSGDPDIADGMARLDASGAGREFARGSKAWSEDTGGVIRLRNEAKEKFEPSGELIEGARTNLMTQSSFVNGTTGWTKTENTGAGTFAADTSELLFDSDVTAQSVSVTVTTAPYDIVIARATDSLSATTEYTASFDWKQSGAATTRFALLNDTTANWLQSNGTWDAASAAIDLGTATGSIERDAVTFTTEGTASTHTLYVVFNGSTNGTVHHAYHVQVEAGAWASSRIVTEATAVTRALDSLRIRNDVSLAQPIWPVDKFTARFLFTPQWDSADVSSTMTLLELHHTETAPTDAAVDWTAASTMMFLTGVWPDAIDSPVGYLVCWVRLDGGDATDMTIITNNQRAIELSRNSSNKFVLLIEDSAANQLVDVVSSSSFTSSASWRCVMASWDLTDPGNEELRFYVGDVDEEGTVNTLSNGDAYFGSSNWGFGADWNAARQLNGSTGDFVLSGKEFIDFDVTANRRLFYSASGNPIWLGPAGAPTGKRPDLYMYGDSTRYQFNAGTLGQPTLGVDVASWIPFSGGPSTASSPPTRESGDNSLRVEHTSSNQLDFTYEHVGTSEVASYASANLVAGTEYEIVVRKTSNSGELDEANNTLSIFLDGTKGGTEDTAPGSIIQASVSYLQIGALNDDTQQAFGHFGEIMVSPIVFSDTEVSGGLP
jgi:hypothetical protein